MIPKIKAYLCKFLIIIGAILFDVTEYKLTGVTFIIMGFLLDIDE